MIYDPVAEAENLKLKHMQEIWNASQDDLYKNLTEIAHQDSLQLHAAIKQAANNDMLSAFEHLAEIGDENLWEKHFLSEGMTELLSNIPDPNNKVAELKLRYERNGLHDRKTALEICLNHPNGGTEIALQILRMLKTRAQKGETDFVNNYLEISGLKVRENEPKAAWSKKLNCIFDILEGKPTKISNKPDAAPAHKDLVSGIQQT